METIPKSICDFRKYRAVGVNHSIMWFVFFSTNLWKKSIFYALAIQTKEQIKRTKHTTMLGNRASQPNAASNPYSHCITRTDPELTMAALSWKIL